MRSATRLFWTADHLVLAILGIGFFMAYVWYAYDPSAKKNDNDIITKSAYCLPMEVVIKPAPSLKLWCDYNREMYMVVEPERVQRFFNAHISESSGRQTQRMLTCSIARNGRIVDCI